MKKIFFGIVISVLFASIVAAKFDAFGYNRQARNFVGTCKSWHMEKYSSSEAQAAAYCGIYANDKLVMKWNAEWDRGNAEGWANPPYDAWEDNQWNGAFQGGSGEVYHFKAKWNADCAKGTYEDEGYCIWRQFEVLSEHYSDPSGHVWLTHVSPAGYGN